jgi:hypothetical protein
MVKGTNNVKTTIATLSSLKPKILQDGHKNNNVPRKLINLFQGWGRVSLRCGGVHLSVWAEIPLKPGGFMDCVPNSLTVVQHHGQQPLGTPLRLQGIQP